MSRCPIAVIKTPDKRWDVIMKRRGAPVQLALIVYNQETFAQFKDM